MGEKKSLARWAAQGLARYFAQHPWVLIGAVVVYLISPIDLVPEGLLGPIGYLDDFLVLLLPLLVREYVKKVSRRRLPERLHRHDGPIDLLMVDKAIILEAERSYYAALVSGKLEALDQALAEDFTLIDVVSGSAVPKSILISMVASGQLKFDSIEPMEWLVRTYPPAAVVTGRCRMKGIYNGAPFVIHSRYTHVYVELQGRWRLVAAQGTPVSNPN